ncbi:hypothetical protein HPB50_016278 [Hyalomma asiaticum]|uniref:Uncharacterized protein n=1 Tax=Hyalomma asiaticum TaxID=266040 RepID=A0ACB7SG19_HYAAI|nr:hypothetical protein HPB50_016278 [Hyalomma asiaticum]
MGSTAEDSSSTKHSDEYDGYNMSSSGTLSSTESYESQATLTIQTKQLPNVASSETVEQPGKPELHSTFRIVPFLAEDAIFRPAIPAHSSVMNNTAAYPRIVNTDPRDTVEDNCFVDGHLYVNGEMIKKGNPCELCRCYYGRELCQQKNCPLPPSPACISEAVPGFCCPKYTCRCNIYGRLYGVNEVVRELSSKCKACTCTSLGVQCNETC